MSETINIANNRKANFEYHISETIEAGIQLTGSEIKSVRSQEVNLGDSYCTFLNNELWVKGMHIAPYKEATHYNHEAKRDRKLLLNKKEIKKLLTKVKEKGFTIVPVRMYISERGFAKVEIGLAKGKKLYDKRQDVKKRDAKREIQKLAKHQY
ncbi:MAG: SsrA-binding protein SmpB [Bacteroidia bacterium]